MLGPGPMQQRDDVDCCIVEAAIRPGDLFVGADSVMFSLTLSFDLMVAIPHPVQPRSVCESDSVEDRCSCLVAGYPAVRGNVMFAVTEFELLLRSFHQRAVFRPPSGVLCTGSSRYADDEDDMIQCVVC